LTAKTRALVSRVFLDLAAFAIPFSVYGYAASGAPGQWDTAELQTTQFILGIPHPTGFPLFILLGWFFSHAFAIGGAAWRLNIFGALCMAWSCVLVREIAVDLGAEGVPALLAALAFGASEAAIVHGSRADVHDLALFLILAALLCLYRAVKRSSASWLSAAALLTGFGLAAHLTTIWITPALALAAIQLRKTITPAQLIRTGVFLLLPLALYAYLPLRSAYIVAHHIDPTDAPPLSGQVSSIAWDTNRPSTLSGFITEVSGSQFGASEHATRVFAITKYPGYVRQWMNLVADQFNWPIAAVAVFSAALLLFSRKSAAVLVLGAAASVPFAIAYQEVEGDIVRYLMPSLATALAFIAALPSLFESSLVRRVLLVFAAFLLAFTTLYGISTRAYVHAGANDPASGITAIVERRVPDDAILVTQWVDAASLAYAQFVDGRLGKRTLVVGWPGAYVSMYPQWTAQKRVFILVDGSTIGNLATVPSNWLVAQPKIEGWHQLYEIRPTKEQHDRRL